MMKEHEIGYHSSGHSVHPNIPEFTDVEEYTRAYEISLLRETAHIDPLSGILDGPGDFELFKACSPESV